MKIQYLGRFLDSLDNESVTYTMQVQDLADVSKVNSSVTTSFSIPKTKNNYEYLKYLSLSGDTSNIPYIKNECKLYHNGAVLINNGWLIVNNTDENNFNVNIENGIIDFFKAIEGKNIGKDLDLSETTHNKDLVSVLDSFTRNDYCYIVADYNGLNTFFIQSTEFINIDYLVPSLNNKYLWDKIFSTFGFTYSGSVFTTDEFTNLWITYPKAPPVSNSSEEELPEPITRFTANKTNNIPYVYDERNDRFTFTLQNTTLNGVTLANNKITIQSNGTYKINMTTIGEVVIAFPNNWGEYTERAFYSIRPAIILNGVFKTLSESLALRTGDVIEFIGYSDIPLNADYRFESDSFTSYNIKLDQISQAVIDFGNELINLSISEYIKEIMIRFALTPIINNETKNIHFITLDERLNPSKTIDWTDKFIQRTDEKYTYNDYAMNNLFKLKYNDPDANFNNGSITVNNLNLEQSKDLYVSKFYSYNREVTSFYNSVLLTNNVFPIWDREIKETVDNTTNQRTFNVNYKGLENRYYFIRRRIWSNSQVSIGSQVLNVAVNHSPVALVDTKNLSYAEMIVNKYSNFNRVLNDVRIHNINLNININDLLNLDLTALYYFEQENQYYILNRINVDLNTNLAQGEFIKVNYR